MKFENIPKTYSKKYHFSDTVRQYAQYNFEKLTHLIPEIKDSNKTIVIKSGNYYEYHIKSFKEKNLTQIRLIINGFVGKRVPDSNVWSGEIICNFNHGTFKMDALVPNELSYLDEVIMSFCKEIAAIELFIQYSEITTKILPPKEQIWNSHTCVYNNKTQDDITIIDLTWFTNLVKSDAFKVRGHFRLQPHGEGMKERKLIWINEFQKEGYIRGAKMLTQSI